MSISYQKKTIYCNSSTTQPTTSNGARLGSTIEFIYKSSSLIKFIVLDSNRLPVDLSGVSSFSFIIKSSYNGTTLQTVSNSDFILDDPTNGVVSCKAPFTNTPILTLIDDVSSATGYCSLWATESGKDYLLVSFKCLIINRIS